MLASCSATEVGNALLPDELTLGRGEFSSAMVGKVDNPGGRDASPMMSDEEGDASYAALTWHLPSIDKGPSRRERAEIREEALMIDKIVADDIALDTTMANGGAYKADWRHAAGFGVILLILLIILLVKLRRSNGWH